MTSFLEKKVGPFSMFQFIGIVGAILVILAFFLAWGTATVDVLLGGSKTTEYAGMDFFNKTMWAENTDNYNAWQNSIPLITLILAVIALVLSVVPGEYLGGAKTEKILGILSIVVAIVILIMAILFMTWFGEKTGSTSFIIGTAKVAFGIGAYLSLVGSVLVFIVGVMPLLKKITA